MLIWIERELYEEINWPWKSREYISTTTPGINHKTIHHIYRCMNDDGQCHNCNTEYWITHMSYSYVMHSQYDSEFLIIHFLVDHWTHFLCSLTIVSPKSPFFYNIIQENTGLNQNYLLNIKLLMGLRACSINSVFVILKEFALYWRSLPFIVLKVKELSNGIYPASAAWIFTVCKNSQSLGL